MRLPAAPGSADLPRNERETKENPAFAALLTDFDVQEFEREFQRR